MLTFYPAIQKSVIDSFKFCLKNEITKACGIVQLEHTQNNRLPPLHIWFGSKNPAQLDHYFYFTVVSHFFFSAFHITLTPSSPLVFCVSSSSVLISSLVFFVSSSLVLVSSVVIFPSCFSSQPIASCGSSRDTMYLRASSACFLISMTSFCRESIMPSRSM